MILDDLGKQLWPRYRPEFRRLLVAKLLDVYKVNLADPESVSAFLERIHTQQQPPALPAHDATLTPARVG